MLYDGRVRVVHRQDAGRQGPQSEAGWGHVWGNHMKMEYKLSRRELESVHTAVSNEDDRFWRDTLDTLRPLLPPQSHRISRDLHGKMKHAAAGVRGGAPRLIHPTPFPAARPRLPGLRAGD